jgi:NAD(P)-dependent dehydrogenase (short-subunit alcohol dehydrogenase family)
MIEENRAPQIYNFSNTQEMELYFEGKTALVTAVGWGIGVDIAMLYASYGAKVIVSDTSRKAGQDIVTKIKRKKGEAFFIRADLSKASECEKLVNRTISKYGSIDIACNNSAIFSDLRRTSTKGIQTFDDEAGLNLGGLFYCMKYEIEAMQKQGEGIIINMSSIMGPTGLASSSSYVDTKYGIAGQITDTLGKDSRRGIRINVVAPAFINTAMLKDMKAIERDMSKKFPPSCSTSKKEEAAKHVIWLSSYKAPFAAGIY